MSQFPISGGGRLSSSDNPSRRVGGGEIVPTPNTAVNLSRARGSSTVRRGRAAEFLQAIGGVAQGLESYAARVEQDSAEDRAYNRLADQEASIQVDERLARIEAGEQDNAFLSITGGGGERESYVRSEAEGAWQQAQTNADLPDQYKDKFVENYVRRGLLSYARQSTREIAKQEQLNRELWTRNQTNTPYGSTTRSEILSDAEESLGLAPDSAEAQVLADDILVAQAGTYVATLSQSIAAGTNPNNDESMAELRVMLGTPGLRRLAPAITQAIGQINGKANQDDLAAARAGQVQVLASTYSSVGAYAEATATQYDTIKQTLASGGMNEAEAAELTAQLDQRFAAEVIAEFTRKSRNLTAPQDILQLVRDTLAYPVPPHLVAGIEDALFSTYEDAVQELTQFQKDRVNMVRFVELSNQIRDPQVNPVTLREDANEFVADLTAEIEAAKKLGDLNRAMGLWSQASSLTQRLGIPAPTIFDISDLKGALKENNAPVVQAILNDTIRSGSVNDIVQVLPTILDQITSGDADKKATAHWALQKIATAVDPSRLQAIAGSINNRGDQLGFLAAVYVHPDDLDGVDIASIMAQAAYMDEPPPWDPGDISHKHMSGHFSSKLRQGRGPDGNGGERINQNEFTFEDKSGILRNAYKGYYALHIAAGQSGIDAQQSAKASALSRMSNLGILVSNTSSWDGDAEAVFVPAAEVANPHNVLNVFNGSHPADFRSFLSGVVMTAYRADMLEGLTENQVEGILEAGYQHELFRVDSSTMMKLSEGVIALTTSLKDQYGEPITLELSLPEITDWWNKTTNRKLSHRDMTQHLMEEGWAVGKYRDSALGAFGRPLARARNVFTRLGDRDETLDRYHPRFASRSIKDDEKSFRSKTLRDLANDMKIIRLNNEETFGSNNRNRAALDAFKGAAGP